MKLFDDVSNFTASPKIYGVLFLISFFGYMFFNQAIPITDPVESNYTLTAKEMVLSADWVSPRIYGNVWFDKPIFFYWLTALSFQLFGFSEWAARLAPALFAAVGVVLLYWFVSKTNTRRSALLAVVIMGTSFEYILLAKLVITDMVFFVFNCAALGFFYLGYVKMDGTKRWYLAAYVSMALAVLTKGPIGALLPTLVMLLVILLQRNWTELKEMYLLTGVLLFAIVALPWYAAMYTLHGMEFINNFFGVHNYLRATVSEHPKDNVSYYYLAVFVLSMLPWSALAVKALIQGYKDLRSRKSPLLLFLFLWIAAYFGFYSLMATKYLTYTFPILFPVAILTAIQLERMLAQGKTKEIFYWIGVPAALLMVGYMIAAYRYLAGWELGLATAGLLLFLVFSVWKARNRTAVDVFKLLCLCQLGSYIILSLFIFPAIAESRSGKEIAKSMVDLGVEKIGMYQFYSTSAVFYSGKVAIKLIPSSEVTFRQAKELDWSSKYTMPTQGIVEFGAKPPLSDRLIIVRGKQREQFLLETARFNYQLLKDSKGLSYYSIKE
ncbi:ArnT family glycosyltransferase [Pelosinus baikalensis]|uniref:Glycosyltransferase family 39 protein n=1 Tax=Pelosinus baikalensis TaxID=2892015 RepID=A0ABS8HUP0_9FIRM|nr:glycosyltransferase family 39 protein [Pelosinus baikalensis]MCC5465968.1 glycosyltransferase family 39 protein [Pelosinus baikalensis]